LEVWSQFGKRAKGGLRWRTSGSGENQKFANVSTGEDERHIYLNGEIRSPALSDHQKRGKALRTRTAVFSSVGLAKTYGLSLWKRQGKAFRSCQADVRDERWHSARRLWLSEAFPVVSTVGGQKQRVKKSGLRARKAAGVRPLGQKKKGGTNPPGSLIRVGELFGCGSQESASCIHGDPHTNGMARITKGRKV